MPHTVNGLWDNFICFENIYVGYIDAARGKRYRNEILAFKANLEENLFAIIKDLRENTYKPLPLRQFFITDPKKRLISAPVFRDRVVHHALVKIIEPIFEKRFINESFACRVGRGTHAAMRYVHKSTQLAKRRWGNYYVFKGDVTKYFPSINHDILKQYIKRAIRDRRILNLIDIIIDSHNTEGWEKTGIPIGTLTSQLFANIYLDPLDHFLKETCQVKYYARYMDDFLIIHEDKEFLRELYGWIERLLTEQKVSLNPKTEIYHGKQGIDFCGYRIWPSHIKPRKRTVKRAKRRMKKMVRTYQSNPEILEHVKASLQSFFGYIMHCSGYRTTKSLLFQTAFVPRKKEKVKEEKAVDKN